MQSTGIFRRIDDLGRIVIPKETRILLGLNEGDSMEIRWNTEDRSVTFMATSTPIKYKAT